ncbi:MAG: antibiotic biosynthesis monooxygenase, partial [Acidobacteriota bacterium]
MVSVALLVRLQAKPGKESEVEAFLRSGLAIVQQEPATTAWFAIRMG